MSNFFSLYNDYTKRTEPPPNFHAWSSIAALSALLGKKCFIPQGHFTVYPNLYIVLVGDPGTRKSTALNVAKNLVRIIEKVPVAPESSTREALIDDMSQNKVEWQYMGKDMSYWQSSAFVGELEQFFGGKHINQQMVGFLTAIWDEPMFKERTRKGGEVIINNPYFSMLGCCTPQWMNTKLQQDVISDGFSRRTIFVHGSELNLLNPWPESSKEELILLTQLQVEARRIFALGGLFQFTKEAREVWDAQYVSVREQAKKFSVKVQHYFSSKHILAQKIAMCISAGVRSDRIVDSRILDMAFRFLTEAEKSLDAIFSGVGRNELKALSDQVFSWIQQRGEAGISHRNLMAQAYDNVNMMEFKETLAHLQETGKIRTLIQQDVGLPIYYAEQLKMQSQEVSLLELASHIVPSEEQPSVKISPSSAEHPIDPIAEQLLTRQKQREVLQQSGTLFQGKLSSLLQKNFAPTKWGPADRP